MLEVKCKMVVNSKILLHFVMLILMILFIFMQYPASYKQLHQ